ncbi:hypothetical protein H310_02925 [Aphanomyces invadans]|uniref:Thioredoxin domain-containing protein n=1 Tax=Aphanomyces invadans TaxID=157072 RepID=A0A024ULN7_9STRA|nr:hypothetical protein H310_02925 [Aphanomyces invadans]ETW06767.1 hypothetical protein H310_02925 [Aphanomyces invadans]|eukprot:XP_008864842.1 hypothetical protein H310_02925 [Aphanomyces invadans]
MAAKFSMAGGSSLFGAEDHLEASDRMGQAMEQLKVREQHESLQRQHQQLVQQQQLVAKLDAQENKHIRETIRPEHYEPNSLQNAQETTTASDDEDDFDDDLDQDPDFIRLREIRLKQLQEQYKLKAENLAKGHGDYREIVQDEFLKEVTSSARVLVHFYHRDFERCKIIDMHLGRFAKRHVEVKVLKIDAEKAPFFISKLVVRVLPTIIFFENGIANDDRIVGFEGLTDDVPLGHEDEFPTVNLARRLAKIGALNSADDDEDDEDDGRKDKRSSIQQGLNRGYDADD